MNKNYCTATIFHSSIASGQHASIYLLPTLVLIKDHKPIKLQLGLHQETAIYLWLWTWTAYAWTGIMDTTHKQRILVCVIYFSFFSRQVIKDGKEARPQCQKVQFLLLFFTNGTHRSRWCMWQSRQSDKFQINLSLNWCQTSFQVTTLRLSHVFQILVWQSNCITSHVVWLDTMFPR